MSRTRTRTLAVLAATALALASVALAGPATPKVSDRTAGLPPLIDRDLFFGDPEISGAQISPDGRFIAFIKPLNGTRNIWVKETAKPFDAARPLTADTKRPIPAYFWSRDGKFILFVQDQAGNENFNIYAVDPAAKPAEGKQVPDARNLTDLKSVRAMIYAVPKTDPDTIYVGLNDRDAAWHDLYRVKISTGERTLVRKNTERVVGWTFDNKGQLRLATRSTESGDTEILRVDPNGEFVKVYSCPVLESCDAVHFDKENRRVYLETNKGDARDLTQLVLFDPADGKEELVESDPLKRVDFGSAIFSDATDELVGTAYVDEYRRIYWRNKAWEADYKLLTSKLPRLDVTPISSTKDEHLWLVSASSDIEPGTVYLFDRGTKKLTEQYRVFDKLPRQALAPMKPVRYPSSDGLEIPAYLVLPKGVPPKNLPVVMFPHGGPWARDQWRYSSIAQFLANRGYAVLEPNFRGSTGYGKKFLNAGNREWGQKMQDDITWGVKYLVAQGIADPKRVAIMGGSYGGYATLAGVTFTPDLYAAAVSIVGPSNLITLLESIPAYWEAARTTFYVRMGDPSTAEGKAQLERQSPLNAAQKIRTPLLVIQGANDPRVNKAESDRIVIALRDRGFPVEYLVAPDEGHGFARPVNNLAMFATAEKFLAKHIGGRFQESMTPEVATRLGEITVDPKTVKLQPKVDVSKVDAPKPATALAAGSLKYKSKLEANGQSMDMAVAREVKQDAGRWVITDTATGPMNAQDRVFLDGQTLVLARREVAQGPLAIELEFKDGKATGTLKMGGDPKPLTIDVGGPVFADGAGAAEVIGTLPLADGYSVLFRNVDLRTQKPTVKQLKVVGSEQVTVPAGTFDAFKVEIGAVDGGSDTTTAWIGKDKRHLVKSISHVGGATVTTELVP